MCGAVVLYFFLQSGLISGSLLPDVTKLDTDSLQSIGIHGMIVPNKTWALMVVWSFLAGFSERLVPNILSSTEKKLAPATQK